MSLAMVVFPQSVPSQPAWLVWVLAVVAAVLFYASLLFQAATSLRSACLKRT